MNAPLMDPSEASQKQRRWVERVHELLGAVRQWHVSLSEVTEHPVHEVADCPHCEAESQLRQAVDALWVQPDDPQP
jgi:hypothetical protein